MKKSPDFHQGIFLNPGGSGRIRTHGGLASSAVFKTAALNHSATLPWGLCLATQTGTHYSGTF